MRSRRSDRLGSLSSGRPARGGILDPQSPDLSQPTFETWAAADGTVITIRLIRAADLALEQAFVNGLSKATGYQRLMSARSPSREELTRLTKVTRNAKRGLSAEQASYLKAT